MRNYVVVAESIRARIFSSETNLGPLTEINDLVNPAGRLNERDLDADKPGRGQGAGGSHGLGNAEVTRKHEA
ncbi:MAG: host attachment protein, partial [Pseudomonadales bacterium]|nr:host attachment protein [Pseudomonadales bacterium]